MLVRIVSAPKGLDYYGVIQTGVVHLGKSMVCRSEKDSKEGVLDIPNGNDEDIHILKTVARITVERINQ